MSMNNSRFLALPLDSQELTQQLNLQLLQKEILIIMDDRTTKQVGIGFAWGTGPVALNR